MIPTVITLVTVATTTAVASDESTIVDTSISMLLFIFSSIRSLFSQGTYLAFSPVRLTYKITTWLIRKIILNITQLASYPVVSFILAAIGCGLLIGFCAGFAVEAFSSMLLSATWGKPPPKTITTEEEEQQEEEAAEESLGQEEPHDDQASLLAMSSELKSSFKQKEPLKFEQFSDDDYSIFDEEKEQTLDDEKTELMHEILKRHLAQVSQEQQKQQGNLRRRTPVVP